MCENISNEYPLHPSMSKRDWLLLGLSLIPAGLMAFGDLIEDERWIWMYTSVFHLLIVLLSLFSVGKKCKPNRAAVFLLVCDCMLIALGFVHYDLFLCLANCLMIPMLTMLSTLSLSGALPGSPLECGCIQQAFTGSLKRLFQHIPLPFRCAFQRRENASGKLAAVACSLMICMVVLIVVVLLLADADAVFLNWCDAFIQDLSAFTDSSAIVRTSIMLISTLMIFSWMFATRRPIEIKTTTSPAILPPVFPAMLLPMLNVTYALFVYIQFSNLFGGAQTAAMSGGYAEYARSGFFQLVTVAAINLCVLSLALRHRSRWNLIMAALMIGFTAVILASAFKRMMLYILTYGLTVLRVLTLWGMLLIAVLLVVFAIALAVRRMPAFKIGLICALVLWVGLNAANIDQLIAFYNMSGILGGLEIDVDYLYTLSPSAWYFLDEVPIVP